MSVARPLISALEHEFDARPVQENPVVTWEDRSGNGADGTGVNSPAYDAGGWLPGNRDLGAVQLDLVREDHLTFDGSALVGTELTVFFVAKRVSTRTLVFGGSTLVTNLGMLQAGIGGNGKIIFNFFDTGDGDDDLQSADGLVAPGALAVVSLRHSNTDGKTIRLNGVEVAASPTGQSDLASWANPYIGTIQTTFFSDGSIAWISTHSQAVSPVEIERMEAWLTQEFGPFSGFPRVVEPERASGLFNPGAVKRRTNAGLTQIRSITGIGWSWEEVYPLLRVTDPDHAELMAFVKDAWHAGKIFLAVHPLRPGSGIAPNGLGTVNVLVKGGGQVGASVLTDGWPSSTAGCVVVGDVIQVAGEVAVYVVTATAASNAAGEVLVRLNPPLRSTPADNAPVATTGVQFQVTILDRSRFEAARPPNLYGGYRVTFAEALL